MLYINFYKENYKGPTEETYEVLISLKLSELCDSGIRISARDFKGAQLETNCDNI